MSGNFGEILVPMRSAQHAPHTDVPRVLCKTCGRPFYEHAELKCLFSSTTWDPEDSYVYMSRFWIWAQGKDRDNIIAALAYASLGGRI